MSPRGSGVEHFLGKEEVTGSSPVVGSMNIILITFILITKRQFKKSFLKGGINGEGEI
jgi:hypothetical protein